MPKLRNLNVANMSFNAICKNKILAIISEFTLPLVRVSSILVRCRYDKTVRMYMLVQQFKPWLFADTTCTKIVWRRFGHYD